METVRLISYKMTDDTGFAPNPFGRALTLATCKPQIRLRKAPGDWLAGFTSKQLCGDPVGLERLVYLARVSEKMPIAEYFRDARFASKIPRTHDISLCRRAGDNIYEPTTPNAKLPQDFRQLENDNHWDGVQDSCGGCGPKSNRAHDVSGLFVLIAEEFAYFGRSAMVIAPELRPSLASGVSGHGSITHNAVRAQAFIDFVLKAASGRRILGYPTGWGEEDDCWRFPDDSPEASERARPVAHPLSCARR